MMRSPISSNLFNINPVESTNIYIQQQNIYEIQEIRDNK